MEHLESINEFTTNPESSQIELKKINTYKFITLFIITFGLYGTWWMYKSWRFFRDKEKTDILPVMRTLFWIIFLIPLFNKILRLAKQNGYNKSYSSVLLYIGLLIFFFFGRLPEPYFILTFFSIICFIPPFNALNFAVDHCDQFKVVTQDKFNGRQIFLLTLGSILWLLGLIALFIE